MNREIKFRVWTGREMINDIIIQHYKLYPVMQYTGLKDKNGKDIYEGDIMASTYNNAEVKFLDGMFGIKKKDSRHGCGFTNSLSILEIIGNIYETPELIK